MHKKKVMEVGCAGGGGAFSEKIIVLLLTVDAIEGATIVDMAVIVTPATDYELPASVLSALEPKDAKPSALQKAEDIVGTMLAKGVILGRDALDRAKALDEKHRLSSTATARVSSFDKRIGLSEKISVGTSAVNDKVKEMDQKFPAISSPQRMSYRFNRKPKSSALFIQCNFNVLASVVFFWGILQT